MEIDPSSAQAWAELLRLGAAGGDYDDDRAAELVHLLNRRGEPEVLEWALPSLADAEPWHRQAAAWVLGQHGFANGRPYGAQVTPALARAARSERDDETRCFLVRALGRTDDPSWSNELLTYAADPYPSIRESVAALLPTMFVGDPMNEKALSTLIELTQDTDPHVRDWATFSLGSLSELDSEAIRSALRARLDDADEDGSATSGEAALGLALRHDPGVFPYLVRWLAAPTDEVGNLTVEAAGALGDSRLLPALKALRDADWQLTNPLPVLDAAIAALEASAESPPITAG